MTNRKKHYPRSYTAASQSFLEAVYQQNEKDAMQYYEQLNLEEKVYTWSYLLKNKFQSEHSFHVHELYKKELIVSEKNFFKHYVLPLDKHKQRHIETNWFIRNSSNDWLLDSIDNPQNSIFYQIFDHLTKHPDYPGYNKMSHYICDKLNQFSKEQVETFINSHIENKYQKFDNAFLYMVFSFGNEQLVAHTYQYYINRLSEEKKSFLGWNMIFHQKANFITHYKELLISGLNEHISNSKDATEFGRYFSNEKIKTYYDLYECLHPDFRNAFAESFLSQAFLEKHAYKYVKTLLDIREKDQNKIQINTLIFICWRAVHVMPKEERNNVFNAVLSHVKLTGKLSYFKSLIYGDEHIKYAHNQIHVQNITFKNFLRTHLFEELSNEMIEKPTVRRNKL